MIKYPVPADSFNLLTLGLRGAAFLMVGSAVGCAGTGYYKKVESEAKVEWHCPRGTTASITIENEIFTCDAQRPSMFQGLVQLNPFGKLGNND